MRREGLRFRVLEMNVRPREGDTRKGFGKRSVLLGYLSRILTTPQVFWELHITYFCKV